MCVCLCVCVWQGGGVGGGAQVVDLWTGIHTLSPLPTSKIKQSFLSTNLASLLAFEQQAARPYFQLHYLRFSGNHLTHLLAWVAFLIPAYPGMTNPSIIWEIFNPAPSNPQCLVRTDFCVPPSTPVHVKSPSFWLNQGESIREEDHVLKEDQLQDSPAGCWEKAWPWLESVLWPIQVSAWAESVRLDPQSLWFASLQDLQASQTVTL